MFKKGDTLIEVLFAITIFSILMISGLAIMNAGVSKGQAAMQLTMARNNIDAQAEALRFFNSAYLAQYPNIDPNTAAGRWQEVVDGLSSGFLSSDPTVCKRNFTSRNELIVDTRRMRVFKRDRIRPATTFPQLVYGNNRDTNVIDAGNNNFTHSEGIWVEAVVGTNNEYYDFHIRACWNAPGNSVPTTIGTIVRLYVPKS